jgi:hypothetical protein
LPSNTVTANRSQQSSHQSMESLSQIYNQNLRMKFGSAPAQLVTKGFVAEKSLEKRQLNLRKEIDESNNVSIKSQLTHQMLSKTAERGTIDTPISSATRREMANQSAENNFNKLIKKKLNNANRTLYDSANSDDDDDDDDEKHDEVSLGSHSSNLSSANSLNNKYKYKQQASKIKLPPLELPNNNSSLSNQDENYSTSNNNNNNNNKKSISKLPLLA